MMNRGQKRLVEKQKHKLIGEIRILCDMLDEAELFSQYSKIERARMADAYREEEAKQEAAKENMSNDPIMMAMKQKANEPEGENAPKPGEKVARPMTEQENRKVTHFPPHDDDFFHRIGQEFDALRNSCMSRKEIMQFTDIKRQKQESKRMTGFWKGALKAIEYSMQLNTFNELEYF